MSAKRVNYQRNSDLAGASDLYRAAGTISCPACNAEPHYHCTYRLADKYGESMTIHHAARIDAGRRYLQRLTEVDNGR